jgi:F420H(2)-dependent quinone reductase
LRNRNVRARIATDAERPALWPKFVAAYPGYEFFQRNARGRKIPIMILDPVKESAAPGAPRN